MYCENCFKDDLKTWIDSDYNGGNIFCCEGCEEQYREENPPLAQ